MRVAPPTSTTPSMSSTDSAASRSALRTDPKVRSTKAAPKPSSCVPSQRDGDAPAARQAGEHLGFLVKGQAFLGPARLLQQQAMILRPPFRATFACGRDPVEHRCVEIIATQRRIAVHGQHFEQAPGEPQHGKIESSAAQVVDGIDAFAGVLQAVRDGRGGRFVQQSQHIEAGEPRGVLGGLALGIVEIGGHRDHGADEFAAEGPFGAHSAGLSESPPKPPPGCAGPPRYPATMP